MSANLLFSLILWSCTYGCCGVAEPVLVDESDTLYQAIVDGDLEGVQQALDNGGSPNTRYKFGQSPDHFFAKRETVLCIAIKLQDIDAIKVLLADKRLKINQKSYGGWTAMDSALQLVSTPQGLKVQNAEIAQLLREHRARTSSELRMGRPSKAWIRYLPKIVLTGTVTEKHDGHLTIKEKKSGILRPAMGQKLDQVQLNQQVNVVGRLYPFAPILKRNTIWIESLTNRPEANSSNTETANEKDQK